MEDLSITKEIVSANYGMSNERMTAAKEFFKRMHDEEDFNITISILDDVMDVLTSYAIGLGTNEHKKNSDAITMICYLNDTINTLKYIATQDILKKEG